MESDAIELRQDEKNGKGAKGLGRKKKYSAATLRKAVDRYFQSISRVADVTEEVWTGELDENGHRVYERVPVKNQLGETVRRVEFLLPPEEGALCRALGISTTTWESYGRTEGMAEIVEDAKDTIRAWLWREMLTRSGKDVKGIQFNLENNYGASQRQSIGVEGVEDFLRGMEK